MLHVSQPLRCRFLADVATTAAEDDQTGRLMVAKRIAQDMCAATADCRHGRAVVANINADSSHILRAAVFFACSWPFKLLPRGSYSRETLLVELLVTLPPLHALAHVLSTSLVGLA